MDEPTAAPEPAITCEILGSVPIRLRVVLARRRMTVASLMALREGAELTLDRRVGEPVELLIGDRLFGRGELVSLDGEGVGVSITEIAGA